MLAIGLRVNGQDSLKFRYLKYFPSRIDSVLITEDSAYYYSLLQKNLGKFDTKINSLPKKGKSKVLIVKPTPRLSLSGGYVGYTATYRSFLDTPYQEKNILQHNISGQLYGEAFGIPLQAIYYIRQSNSSFFRNIYDVQLSLDQASVRRKISDELKRQSESYASFLEDSLKGKLIDLKQFKLDIVKEWLKSSFQRQRLIEAHEILEVPHITYKPEFSYDQNQSREDSLKRRAQRFLSLYESVDSMYSKYKGQLDSVTNEYNENKQKARELRSLSTAATGSYAGYLDYKSELKRLGVPEQELSNKYKNLLSMRNMSVGRSYLNQSDLTAKNISINGINFEYNSWYYASISAGLVDFRFRDFATNALKQKQYLALGRIGIGNIDKSFFIFSAFTGKKQLFAADPTGTRTTAIDLKGYGLEGKWRFNRNIFISGEVAESISPDFRKPISDDSKPSSSDFTNNALAARLSAYYPLSGSRLEGYYKFTGSNYQSFSSFQTNSALKTWFIKADQQFFKRILKLTLSVRSNDFSNPYVIQDYKSNTVFKSASVSFRKRHLPVFSLSYMPMSQYTVVNQYVMENRFQSLNTSIYHLYRLGDTKTASTIMYNKFYNTSADSGFIYFNASNIYFVQNIFLGRAIANLSISDTRNSEYQCQVFDESIQMNFDGFPSLTTGVKINNFNKQEVKVGGYISGGVKVLRSDMLYFSFERGYLPGVNHKLNINDIATIQFIKTFGAVNN